MDFVGRQINNWRLVAKLNKGGYGAVYRAEHIYLKEVVAIKLLFGYDDSDEKHQKVIQEAQFLASFNHEFILRVRDVGFSPDLPPYIITDYAPNGSLRDFLKKQHGHPLSHELALKLLTQIGQALDYAHQHHIVHLDLKPENILFNAQNNVLLCDFGIATLMTATSSMRATHSIGTAAYMAPERFKGKASREADQYALGCIAYELYTGRKVFDASDNLVLLRLHTEALPDSPSRYNAQIPAHVEQAILQALTKERKNRHASVAAFVEALNQVPTAPITLPTADSFSIPLQNWLHEGEEHSKNQRHKDAARAYDLALQLDPTHVNALIGKGKSLFALEVFEEAAKVFQTLVNLEQHNAEHQDWLGRALYSLQRYEEALLAFAEATRLDPGGAAYFKMQGESLFELKRFAEALLAFQEAARLEPDISTHTRRIDEIQDLLKANQAESPVVLPLKTHPQEQALAQFELGNGFFKQKDYEQALATFAEAARLDPQNAWYQHWQGRALLSLSQPQESLLTFQEAIRLEPTNSAHQDWLGRVLISLQCYQEALEVFAQAADHFPKNAYFLRMQGEVLYQLKNYPLALKMFQEAKRMDPKNRTHRKRQEEIYTLLAPEDQEAQTPVLLPPPPGSALDYYTQGTQHFQNKGYKKALLAFNEALLLEPQNTSYLYHRGRTLLGLEQTELSLSIFTEVVQREPENATYQDWLGRVLYSLEHYEKALAAFAEASHLQPENAYYFKMQGEALCELKNYPSALKMFEEAVRLLPEALAYRKRSEEIQAFQVASQARGLSASLSASPQPSDELGSQDPAPAKLHFSAAESARTHYIQGMQFFQSKAYKKALLAFNEAAVLDLPNVKYLYWRGRALFSLNLPEKALLAFTEAIRLEPENAAHQEWYGHACYRLEDYEKALEAFAEASRLQPGMASHFKMQGEILCKLKNYSSALHMFREAMRVEPENLSYRKRIEELQTLLRQPQEANSPSAAPQQPEGQESQIPEPRSALEYYAQGLFFRSRHYEKALRAFSKAVQMEPHNALYRYWRGRALLSLGLTEKALVAFQKAVDLEPGNASYQDWRGRTLYDLKLYKNALEAFTEAVRIDPKYAYCVKMQGEVLCELKQYAQALAAYEKVALMEPESSAHQKRIEEIRALLQQPQERE